MEIKQIKELISSDTYSFLRENEHLKDRIMILTLGGSHAYGTSNENSDVDVRGVAAEGPNEIIGLSTFEQFDNEATDTVIYSLRKITSLMLNTNPNTIEIMGTEPEQIFLLSEEGKMLRDNVDLFLSRKARYSFGGYANQQLRRLQNALARDEYPQKEKEKHIMGSIKNQMEHLMRTYTEFDGKNIKLYLDKTAREGFEEEIFMDINFQHYPLRDFKDIYSEMHNIVKEYGHLNHRNSKKDVEHLNKHAMHLIRLYLMGMEIMKGEGIHTYRKNDRDFLLDIRNGMFTYEEIFSMVDQYEKEFEYVADNSPLPEKPDYRKVEELIMEINKKLLRKYGV